MTLTNGKSSLIFNEETAGFVFENNGYTIKTDDKLLAFYVNGKSEKILLADSLSKNVCRYDTGFGSGIKAEYNFSDVDIFLYCWVEDLTNELYCEIRAEEKEGNLDYISWPTSIDSGYSENGYTVLPIMQGMLIKDNSEDEVNELFKDAFFDRGATMPWWGYACDNGGYMAIADTPFDAGYTFSHEHQNSVNVKVKWKTSLGKFDYSRKLHYTLMGKGCGYVDFCKNYRAFAIQNGNFVTLKEKMIKNPKLEKLIGSTVFNTSIAYWNPPTSSKYYKEENNEWYFTFETLGNEIENIKNIGIKDLYIHVDGWNRGGYDIEYPDNYPPAEICGGLEGFKKFKEKCQSYGYLFAIHDQYHDFYQNSPSFDKSQAAVDADGTVWEGNDWPGGPETHLCQKISPYYLRRNLGRMKADYVLPDGAYLDVYSAIVPDECSNKDHRMTRKESVEWRNRCFEIVRSNSMLVSSEEGIDCYIPHLDLVHHSPYFYAFCEFYNKPEYGIPVPLINLVYHECLFIPWSREKGAWGIPKGQSGFLHCLLNGGILTYVDKLNPEEKEKIELVSRLNKLLYDKEMFSHEIISENNLRQKTVFSNGITVTVDFGEMWAEILWDDGRKEKVYDR